MKNDSSASETLIMALPVLLVLLALVGAIIFFPQGSLLDIRGKAAPVTIAPTRVPVPPIKKLESVCPDLYKPVCSTVTNTTYANECEARAANGLPIKAGICPTTTATPAILPNAY